MRKLVKCRACKKKISVNAESCPHCGEPLHQKPTETKIKPIKTENKGNRRLAWIVLILIFVFWIFSPDEESGPSLTQAEIQKAKENAQLAIKRSQENMAYFEANRDQVISSIEAAYSNKEYQSVVSETGKYLASKDPKVVQYNADAKAALAAIEKADKTNKILTELKTIPMNEFAKNKAMYQQLLSMHPGNEKYKDKVAFYDRKLKDFEAAKKAAENRKGKIEYQFSSWDGSHRNLTRAIKESMNDPDSYDHVETRYRDNGDHLMVMTTFRGRNAFGGMVKNTITAKVSLDGDILQVYE